MSGKQQASPLWAGAAAAKIWSGRGSKQNRRRFSLPLQRRGKGSRHQRGKQCRGAARPVGSAATGDHPDSGIGPKRRPRALISGAN